MFIKSFRSKIERMVFKHYLKKWELLAMMSSTWQNKSFSTVFSPENISLEFNPLMRDSFLYPVSRNPVEKFQHTTDTTYH